MLFVGVVEVFLLSLFQRNEERYGRGKESYIRRKREREEEEALGGEGGHVCEGNDAGGGFFEDSLLSPNGFMFVISP